MFLNKGTLAGNTVIKPETVELMRTNAIGDLRLYSDGTTANPGLPGVGFGMDFAIYDDPSATSQPYGKGTHYWGGAAGTWFWIDPGQRPLLRRHDPVDGRRASGRHELPQRVRKARLRSARADRRRHRRTGDAAKKRTRALARGDGKRPGRRWEHGLNAALFSRSNDRRADSAG